jgi:hypothetical protein
MPSLPTFIQHILGILTIVVRQEEEIKGIQIGKEVVKLSLFADDMVLYLKHQKNSTPKTYIP